MASNIAICYVEECVDSNLHGLSTDFQPTNTTVNCAAGVHMTRSGGYMNQSDETSNETNRVKCSIVS